VGVVDASGVVVTRIKAVRHAAKAWARKNRSPPAIYHNYSFLILLFDMFEEWRNLSVGE
jgi:hypothetical protein